MKNLLASSFITTFLLLTGLPGQASHVQGGFISVKKIGNLTFEFTFIGYRDRGSTIPFGGGDFRFGDGNVLENVAQSTAINVVSISHHTDSVYFTVTHQYGAHGTYVVSYEEEYRNDDILNIQNSVVTTFHVETEFFTEVDNSSPLPPGDLISHMYLGEVLLRNFAFKDAEGDIIRYSLTVPKQSRHHYVNNYRFPDHPQFYTNYENGNYGGDDIPIFATNRRTGTLLWDMPGDAEVNGTREYAVAISVREYRILNGVETRISSTTVDILLRLEEPSEHSMNVIGLEKTFCTADDATLSFEVVSNDPYMFSVNPPSSIFSINGLPVEQMLDSTFAESTSFEVVFNASEEEQLISFNIRLAEEENFSSFSYLLSDNCEDYVLSSTTSKVDVAIFPNPAFEEVWVKGVQEPMNYSLLSLDGKRIKRGILHNENPQVSVSELANGIYLLKLQETRTHQSITKKLIVKRL